MNYMVLKQRLGGTTRRLAPLAGLVLAACADFAGIAPQARKLDAQALNVGTALAPAADAAWPEQAWWQAYGDPQLDRLVTAARAGNPGLRIALARVEQARGLAAIAEAAELPNVEFGARAIRTYSTHEEFSPSLIGANTYWQAGALLRASYELDLWGKDRHAAESALDAVHAGEAEAQAARLALTTAVVQAYVQLSADHALRDLAVENLERQQKILDIARRRLKAGLGTQLELNEAATRPPETEAQIERLDERLQLQRHLLAALAGEGPGDGDAIARPALRLDAPARVPAELPAGLLGHRPDIVAQRWRVEASAQDIAVAKARFYPDINLAAFAGVASLNLSTLLGGSAATGGFGPALSLPVFDGGRLRGNLRAQTAGYDAAVESYNAAVIAALREVADEVTSLRSLARQLEHTEAALATATVANEQADQGFRAGLTDYLSVLNTQAGLLAQQRSRAELIARQFAAHAALMKALGGGYLEPAAAAGTAK